MALAPPRRTLGAALLAGLTLSSLVACGGDEETPQAATTPATTSSTRRRRPRHRRRCSGRSPAWRAAPSRPARRSR
ncbi:hypothetical protein [Modestobacter italicus]|uniref:hypothetical protein n=1 Tax=Modestobacter italicus (strain DSM 44449 / CECT 9708 / BC 501) TaxID=2732864 RepID=UPI001E2CC563|nr:hypothetical protein [Modestobacter marinus]